MKILSLLAITATVGLASFSFKLATPSVSQDLIDEKTKLIEKNDVKGWEIKAKEYSETKSTDIDEKKDINAEELKKWCLSNLYKPSDKNNRDLYEKIKRWCSKPKTMEDYVSEQHKYVFIKDNDRAAWEAKVRSYEDFWRITGIYDNISISGDGKKVLKKDMTVSKLKIWCSHKRIEYHDKSKGKWSDDVMTIRKWCTNYPYSY